MKKWEILIRKLEFWSGALYLQLGLETNFFGRHIEPDMPPELIWNQDQ